MAVRSDVRNMGHGVIRSYAIHKRSRMQKAKDGVCSEKRIEKETRMKSVRERGMPACFSLSFGLDELLLVEGWTFQGLKVN